MNDHPLLCPLPSRERSSYEGSQTCKFRIRLSYSICRLLDGLEARIANSQLSLLPLDGGELKSG